MKSDHPPYQEVLFVDTSTGTKFVCGSTLFPKETETYEGTEYPVCRVTVSSASHPFFTGSKRFIDAEGRVDKFLNKYVRKQQENKKRSVDEAQLSSEKNIKKKKKKK